MKQETSQWGKAVKKAVIDHDMTLKQLAEKIGYSNATVSQVVNGRYSNIQNFIGQSSSEADRQREYYNRMKAEKEALAGESTETPELPEPKEPVLPAEQKSNKAIGNYTTDFEELWEAYPRKVDKGQAYKKYKARLEDGFSHEQLYEAVKNYAAQCKKQRTETMYIKHGKTFLGESTPFLDYLPKDKPAQSEAEYDDNENPFGRSE